MKFQSLVVGATLTLALSGCTMFGNAYSGTPRDYGDTAPRTATVGPDYTTKQVQLTASTTGMTSGTAPAGATSADSRGPGDQMPVRAGTSRGRSAGDPRVIDHSADTLVVEPTVTTIPIPSR